MVRGDTDLDRRLARIKDEFGADVVIVSPMHENDDAAVEATSTQASISELLAAVVQSNSPLVIEDVAHAETHADDAFLLVNNVQAYAGVPLRLPDGTAIGSLNVLFHEPRSFSSDDLNRLSDAASAVVRSTLSPELKPQLA
jgi:GAF domain-containing protein